MQFIMVRGRYRTKKLPHSAAMWEARGEGRKLPGPLLQKKAVLLMPHRISELRTHFIVPYMEQVS